MNAEAQTSISKYVAVSHDSEVMHIFYTDDQEHSICLERDAILRLIAYAFKNDLVFLP